MDFLKTPFSIGKALLPNNILYAPLAGCSDLPFRKMSCRYRPGIVYCEMVKIDALVRNDPHTYKLLDYAPDMHPIGAQLCGSKPEMAAASARILEDLGFDVIDFNCGCPVDKVTKDGSGSGMLKTPELIGEILSKVIAAVNIPVTVKIRAGWDEKSINAPLITRIAEQAGAKAIAIHGRTREQGYEGSANWDFIKDCKAVAKDILVIGNGDIFDAEAAHNIFKHTGCEAILVSRGTMGAPWIVEDIMRHLKGEPPVERDASFLRAALLEHFESIISYQNERQALLDFRRVGCWYLKGCVGAKPLRMQLNQTRTSSEVFSLIQNFPWHSLRDPLHAASSQR
jgi:tRNA-dihydrouridine synthase B